MSLSLSLIILIILDNKMMKIKNFFLALLILPILAACHYDDILAKIVTYEESAFAKRYFESIRVGDVDSVKKILNPKLLSPEFNIAKVITDVASYFPSGNPIEVKLVGAQTYQTPDKWQAKLVYQYKFPKEWVLATITYSKIGQQRVVDGFSAFRQSQSLEETNAFNLLDKTPTHYLVLILAVVIILFTLWALVLCIQTEFPRRKWLWILFVLTGFFSLTFNWTTGEFDYQIFSLNFLVIGITASSPYAPWMINISLPIGAMTFLLKRKAYSKTVHHI